MAFRDDNFAALSRERGFHLKRQKGSHSVMRRDVPFAQVVVPEHRSLDTGTLAAILDAAGMSADDLLKLL